MKRLIVLLLLCACAAAALPGCKEISEPVQHLELNENILSVWKNTDRETAAEILTKIQNSPSFLLESKEADRTAPKVAVCEVDGITYFLFTADSDSNEVMRIYCANRTA